MQAVLWGSEHVELGEIATAPVGDRAAAAITRGLHAKAYGYTDPNEDAVAIVTGSRSTLLVCADGHYGITASHVAVAQVLDALGDDPPPALSDREWLDLFARVNDAVLAEKTGKSQHPSTGSVLLVALVAGSEVSWAALGDGAIVVARPGGQRGRQLNKEAMRFLGHKMSSRSLDSVVQRGRDSLAADEWLVLVTDGLSEFIAPLRPADAVPRILARAKTAEEAAAALLEVAGSAGAGDNVAAAVLAPAA